MATKQTAKRIINGERGLVLSKMVVPARESMVINGRVLEAKEETFVVSIISSPEFDDKMGYVNGVIMYYPVEKTLFDKTNFGDIVSCKYEFSQYGTTPISYEILTPAKPQVNKN